VGSICTASRGEIPKNAASKLATSLRKEAPVTDERELLLEQALNSNTLALAHIGTALNINTALLAISANLHSCVLLAQQAGQQSAHSQEKPQ